VPRTDFDRQYGLNQRAPGCLSRRVRVALVPLLRLLLVFSSQAGGGARGAHVSIFKPGEGRERNVDGLFCGEVYWKFLENTTLGGARLGKSAWCRLGGLGMVVLPIPWAVLMPVGVHVCCPPENGVGPEHAENQACSVN
jgi:hypothetical protein